MSDDYKNRSYGEIPVGFGKKPGIVVVDFQKGFTEAQYPLGGAPLVMRAVENTAKLLEVARRYGVPVATCNTAYMNEREMPYWKITAVRETFRHDHPSAELDPRIYDADYDLRVCKKGPSIFFGTGVSDYFTKERVDTVIVTGCNTKRLHPRDLDRFLQLPLSHHRSGGLRWRHRGAAAQGQSARSRPPLCRRIRPEDSTGPA
jgi:maleamate amidohydrolase